MTGPITSRRLAALVAVCNFWLLGADVARGQAVLDQWWDSSCTQSHVENIAINFESAQTFLAGTSGQLTRVDLFLNSFPPTPGQTFTVDIRNTVAGVPTATIAPVGVLASSTVPSAAVPVVPNSWVTFLFAAPTNVCAGQTYAIVLSTNPGSSGGTWYGTIGNVYPQGDIYHRPVPGAWVLIGGRALGFRTFVGNAPYPAPPAPCTPSPPPYAGPPDLSCGGGPSGGGGAPGSPGEGSFAGDPPAVPPGHGEGGFGFGGRALSRTSQAAPLRLPALVGPFRDGPGSPKRQRGTFLAGASGYQGRMVSVPLSFAAAPALGTKLRVANISYQKQTQGGVPPSASTGSEAVLIWSLIVALTLGAAWALAKGIQGLASCAPSPKA